MKYVVTTLIFVAVFSNRFSHTELRVVREDDLRPKVIFLSHLSVRLPEDHQCTEPQSQAHQRETFPVFRVLPSPSRETTSYGFIPSSIPWSDVPKDKEDPTRNVHLLFPFTQDSNDSILYRNQEARCVFLGYSCKIRIRVVLRNCQDCISFSIPFYEDWFHMWWTLEINNFNK